MNVNKPRREYFYTAMDGISRSFTPFEFATAMKVGELLPKLNLDVAGANFAEENYEAFISLFEILFNEKNCSSPLTRKKIESGEHLNTNDVINLWEIALSCEGIFFLMNQ